MSTIKFKDSANVTSLFYRDIPDKDWIPASTQTINKSIVSIFKEKDSVDTGTFIPGTYRVNPYLVQERVRSASATSASLEVRIGGREYKFDHVGNFGAIYLSTLAPPDLLRHSDSVQDDALQKAYSKLGKNEVGVGEALGELRETLQMLKSPLKSIRDFLTGNDYRRLSILNRIMRYLKTGRFPSRRSFLTGAEAAKAAADAWLEIRYGLMPLIYLGQDLIDLANKQALRADFLKGIHSVTANSTREDIYSLPKVVAGASDWTRMEVNPKVVDNCKGHASVQYKLTGLPSKADLLGLSPKFLPELIWELTRCSFVVDWWFDVGQWLGAMRFEPRLTVLGNTSSIKVDRTITSEYALSISIFPGGTSRFIKDATYERHEYFHRSVNRDLPMLPSLDLKFRSLMHTVDALALIAQPLAKKMFRG